MRILIERSKGTCPEHQSQNGIGFFIEATNGKKIWKINITKLVSSIRCDNTLMNIISRLPQIKTVSIDLQCSTEEQGWIKSSDEAFNLLVNELNLGKDEKVLLYVNKVMMIGLNRLTTSTQSEPSAQKGPAASKAPSNASTPPEVSNDPSRPLGAGLMPPVLPTAHTSQKGPTADPKASEAPPEDRVVTP